MYFAGELAGAPFYQGILTNEVSARLCLAVTSVVRKLKNKRFTVRIKKP